MTRAPKCGQFRFVVLFLLLATELVGCAGEASVTYRGTVTDSSDPAGYSFDSEQNPRRLPPIVGAKVELCLSSCSGARSATTDANGSWGPVETVFGGSLFSDVDIEIRVTLLDGATFSYKTVYEETSDPTNGQKYLNITM